MSNGNYEDMLWKNKEKNIPNPEAFSEKAEELANEVYKAGFNSKKNKLEKNAPSQLRRYYDELFRLNQLTKRLTKSENWSEDWEVILPQVHMVIAKAAYAKGRKLITDEFLNPLQELIKAVKTPEHLNTVVSFFEAFTAFYKQYDRK